MKILITGGTGTLGKAILKKASEGEWEKAWGRSMFTVMSRDPMKLQAIKATFPNLDIETYVGDVANQTTVLMASAGCDLIIHAAAQKHIPEGERHPLMVCATNVTGSMNVIRAAIMNKVKHVVGISTDKACHALNAYGASKLLMEKMFQAMASKDGTPQVHLVRYGNVIGSTGSVIQAWRKMEAETGVVHATDPDMTRFWLTSSQAVDLILKSLTEPSGTISVPTIHALRMGDMAKWILKPETKVVYDGLRPGEKMHEEMISIEETPFTELVGEKKIWRIWPMTGKPINDAPWNNGYASNTTSGMSVSEFYNMLEQA